MERRPQGRRREGSTRMRFGRRLSVPGSLTRLPTYPLTCPPAPLPRLKQPALSRRPEPVQPLEPILQQLHLLGAWRRRHRGFQLQHDAAHLLASLLGGLHFDLRQQFSDLLSDAFVMGDLPQVGGAVPAGRA